MSLGRGSSDEGPLKPFNLEWTIDRVRGLLLDPSSEWPRIARETTTRRDLTLRWVLPLSALFFIAQQLGAMAFPQKINGIAVAPSVLNSLGVILFGTAAMVGGVWAVAWIVAYLAPGFGGRRDDDAAFRLVAWSGTALWLSGVFGLIPFLAIASVVGVYSFYTLWRGLPVMTACDEPRALPFAATATGVTVITALVATMFTGCLSLGMDGARRAVAPPAVSGAETTIATAPASAGAKQAAPVAAPPPPGGAVDPDKLRRLMPDALPGGWVRAAIGENQGGAMGFTGRTVEARYVGASSQTLTLNIIDLGAGGAQPAIDSFVALNPPRDDVARFVAVERRDGFFAAETLDRSTGRFSRIEIFRQRIAVAAEGAPDAARAAITAIDHLRLDQIAQGL